jgi:GTP cyclohydrolase I
MESRTKTEEIQATERNLSQIFRKLIESTNEDPSRNGLEETWKRRAPEMWKTVTGGYDESNKPEMTSFPTEEDGMVVKKDIPFHSLCEHHILPFSGTVHIGYVPDGEIIGLSKLIRYTRWKSRKLSTQERLTQEIAEGLSEEIDPEGVMVAVEAEHMCEVMRGVETPDTTTVTTVAKGVFEESSQGQNPRREFLDQINFNR